MKNVLIVSWLIVGLLFSMMFIEGCGVSGYEWGHHPTGNFDPSPTNLAAFGSVALDGNGIIYTKKAGCIDPDHIWGCARKTRAIYEEAYSCLIAGRLGFSNNGVGASGIVYSSGWSSMPVSQKQKIAEEIALQISERLGYHCEVAHELGTWWGGGMDYQSSFTFEDLYSDFLGAKLAMQAQRMVLDGRGSFSSNITRLANQFMKDNQAIPASECKKICNSLEGTHWKKGGIHRTQLLKHLDMGEDGYVDPAPMPGFTVQNMTRLAYPKIDSVSRYGFEMSLIVDSGSGYYNRCRKVLGLNRQMVLEDHFRLMDVLEKECKAKGYKVYRGNL